MPLEPSELERQRLAFNYLRQHARHAHIAGDGLSANLLCHSGLDHAERLANAGRLLLPLHELSWMPVFALYWLIDPYERHVVEDLVGKLPRHDEEDEAVHLWLASHAYFIGQPLSGEADLFSRLIALPWPALFRERTPEAEALLLHLVELSWFHGPAHGGWETVLSAWEGKGTEWVKHALGVLRQRLASQTPLSAPGKLRPPLPESEAEKLRNQSEAAELWLLHLHGRRKRVRDTVERITPTLTGDSHEWRILADFAYISAGRRNKSESQAVHLARRRRLSADTPLLIFHDKRQQKIDDLLGELFRAQRESMASRRWEIFTLAMLHELSALRLWDYGMWLDAIRAQAEALLESMQWTAEHPGLAVQALILAVRGLAVKSAKDRLTRSAVEKVELAPREILEELAEGLLSTYPLQKHNAAELLDDIIDLLPPATWPDLARWTVSYASDSHEERTTGQRLAPAAHWMWVLQLLPQDSTVWRTLLPQAKDMARITHCWRGGETRGFLRRWLRFAPFEFASEIAEVLIAVIDADNVARIERAKLLIEFEESREQQDHTFTPRLLGSTQSAQESLLLARHLKLNDLMERERALHDRMTTLIKEAIGRALPSKDATSFPVLFPSGVELVNWTRRDSMLFRELISAVSNPAVLADYLPWLLATIQLFVANGPAVFARIVQPHVTAWTRRLPGGRELHSSARGPFSTVHIEGYGSASSVALNLGWLVFQLPRKLGCDAHEDVLVWSREMLLEGHVEPLRMVVYGSMIVAFDSNSERMTEALGLVKAALLTLWSRVNYESEAAYSLGRTLEHLAGPLGANSSEFVDWKSKSAQRALTHLIELFKHLLPKFAKSPNVHIRSGVAELLWRLTKRGPLSPVLAQTLRTLANDNRARVRLEAEGGWKAPDGREARSGKVTRKRVARRAKCR